MPDIGAIAAALSSLKTAKDIAETMIGLRDGAAFQSKLLEFQSKLIDANNAAFAAQDERAALLKRISDLEKEVTDLEAWETTKQRYELKTTNGGGLAWFLKPEAQPTEEPHKICTKCYEDRKRSILQPEGRSGPAAHMGNPAKLYCPACRAKVLA